jgi:hypothetical protein
MLIQAVAQPSKGKEIKDCHAFTGISFRKDKIKMGITQNTVFIKYPITEMVPLNKWNTALIAPSLPSNHSLMFFS